MFKTKKYPDETEVKVRIKKGTVVSHDFHYFLWPGCFAPGTKDEVQNPNMIFNAKLNGGFWELWAPGFGGSIFGRPGTYGCGSIHVSSLDAKNGGIEFVANKELTRDQQINDLYESYINDSNLSKESVEILKKFWTDINRL
jgi:hypothetical protein